MEPFWREDGSDETGGAGDGGGEKAGAEGGTVDEEEELVRVFRVLQYADMMGKANTEKLCQREIWQMRQLQLAKCNKLV